MFDIVYRENMKKTIILTLVMILLGTVTVGVAVAAPQDVQPVPEGIKISCNVLINPILTLSDRSQLLPYPPVLTLPDGQLIWSWLRVMKWTPPVSKPVTPPISSPVTPPISEPIQPIVIRPTSILGGSVQHSFVGGPIWFPIIGGPIKKPIVGTPIEVPIVVPLERN